MPRLIDSVTVNDLATAADQMYRRALQLKEHL